MLTSEKMRKFPIFCAIAAEKHNLKYIHKNNQIQSEKMDKGIAKEVYPR